VPWYPACRLDALDPERGLWVRVAGRDIALFFVDGVVRAVDNRCLHTGGPLADGAVVDGCVICPWHGWVYELATGQKLVGHRSAGDLPVYAVVVEGDEVKVVIPDELRS
jgi:nitrite reductase/ring-hydroxylating ferredoxin subunit